MTLAAALLHPRIAIADRNRMQQCRYARASASPWLFFVFDLLTGVPDAQL